MSEKIEYVGKRPHPTSGMRHVALFVPDFDAACHFYIELMGMAVEWQPDPDNIYLCSGNDNVALHNKPDNVNLDPAHQRLDHIGFIIDEMDDVDSWYDFLKANKVKIQNEPRTHRDGARSFYCLDPAGTLVQLMYHPPLSSGKPSGKPSVSDESEA